MSRRGLSAILDAIAAGRPPKRFRVDPEDVDAVRTAITLRAARPGESAPSQAFVEGLFQRLLEDAEPSVTPETRMVRAPRTRTALVAAAAACVLVAGTVVATESVQGRGAPSATAAHVPQGTELRTATFQTVDGRVLGQIVAYRGRPSWVFLNVSIPNYEGRIECKLQVADGTTVAFGTFAVHSGAGTFSKLIGQVDVSRLRGAELVNPAGSAVAAATFS